MRTQITPCVLFSSLRGVPDPDVFDRFGERDMQLAISNVIRQDCKGGILQKNPIHSIHLGSPRRHVLLTSSSPSSPGPKAYNVN